MEIGYWTHTDHLRQGIATEMAGALTRAAFEIGRMRWVEIRCASKNIASAGVPAKLGFTHEATLRDRLALASGEVDDALVLPSRPRLRGEPPRSESLLGVRRKRPEAPVALTRRCPFHAHARECTAWRRDRRGDQHDRAGVGLQRGLEALDAGQIEVVVGSSSTASSRVAGQITRGRRGSSPHAVVIPHSTCWPGSRRTHGCSYGLSSQVNAYVPPSLPRASLCTGTQSVAATSTFSVGMTSRGSRTRTASRERAASRKGERGDVSKRRGAGRVRGRFPTSSLVSRNRGARAATRLRVAATPGNAMGPTTDRAGTRRDG